MIEARLFEDLAVGETSRVLVDESDRAFRADVERWTERGRRPKVGERWAARLIERSIDGEWFVGLGAGGQGVLRARKSSALIQGARVAATVRSEAHGDKLVVLDAEDGSDAPTVEGRLADASPDAFIRGVRVVDTVSGSEARAVVNAVMEEGLADSVRLPSGGSVWVEQTRAVCALDVDRGASDQPVAGLNLEAAEEAARQIALRGIGGLVVVDFAGSPRGAIGGDLSKVFEQQVRRLTARRVDSLGLSRFGLLQASVPRERRPLADAIGCAPEEREALNALREIETMGLARRGARIGVTMSVPAERWLRSGLASWEEEMGERIGRRWQLATDDRPVGAADIRAIE